MTTVRSQALLSHLPLYLKRFHSWWFAGQVLANVAAAWFFIRLIVEMEWDELGMGLLVGQSFLLSLWLALGGLPNVTRFVSVFLVTLASALAISDQAWIESNLDEWIEQAQQIFIVCFFMVLLFHGLLLPLRWLLGWRLDFDPAYHPRETTGRLQMGVVHILGWMTFLAIPCAMIRLLPPEEIADMAIACLIMAAMTLPVAASFSLAVVGRRTWLWCIVAVALLGITWAAENHLPNLIVDDHFLVFNLGIIAAVAGNLLILRLFGLKLFSVALQLAQVEGQRTNPVTPPHFQIQPVSRSAASAASAS